MAAFGLDAMSTGIITSITGGLVVILIGLAILAISGGLFFLWKGQAKYDIQVRIYSKRKNGYKTWDDVGAYLKNKKTGEVYGFKLKHDKTLLQPPPFEMLMPSLKGNTIHLLQLTSDEYFVLNPDIEEVFDPHGKLMLKVVEGDIQLWATQMIDKLYSMYDRKNFWDKYGSYIVFGITAILCIVLIYSVLQKFDVLAQVATSLDNTAKTLLQLKQTGELVPTGALVAGA